MLWLTSCSNFTSINGIPMDSMLLVSIAFFCLIFFNNWIFSFKICATTFFTFSQPDILPSSRNRSYLMVITFSLRAGFTSGSPSLTSAEIFFGHWSSDSPRKPGPLNHLCDLLDLKASRPLELSSARSYAVGRWCHCTTSEWSRMNWILFVTKILNLLLELLI